MREKSEIKIFKGLLSFFIKITAPMAIKVVRILLAVQRSSQKTK
jgi:hypothetical protein